MGGETLAIHEWSERTGIPESVISKRLNHGWTPKRAVRTPVGKRRGPKPDGSPTVREWSKRTGIPVNIIYVRLSRGWTLERAVGTPVRPRRDA